MAWLIYLSDIFEKLAKIMPPEKIEIFEISYLISQTIHVVGIQKNHLYERCFLSTQ